MIAWWQRSALQINKPDVHRNMLPGPYSRHTNPCQGQMRQEMGGQEAPSFYNREENVESVALSFGVVYLQLRTSVSRKQYRAIDKERTLGYDRNRICND